MKKIHSQKEDNNRPASRGQGGAIAPVPEGDEEHGHSKPLAGAQNQTDLPPPVQRVRGTGDRVVYCTWQGCTQHVRDTENNHRLSLVKLRSQPQSGTLPAQPGLVEHRDKAAAALQPAYIRAHHRGSKG